jgi:hypothetical protein
VKAGQGSKIPCLAGIAVRRQLALWPRFRWANLVVD